MALSPAAEEAFHAAIEAAYLMQAEGASESAQSMAHSLYQKHMRKYLTETREQWWDEQCAKHPDAARCRCFEL